MNHANENAPLNQSRHSSAFLNLGWACLIGPADIFSYDFNRTYKKLRFTVKINVGWADEGSPTGRGIKLSCN